MEEDTRWGKKELTTPRRLEESRRFETSKSSPRRFSFVRSRLSQRRDAAPFPVGEKFVLASGENLVSSTKEEEKSLEEKYSHRDVDGAITGLLPF